jgi:hypothetical protein
MNVQPLDGAQALHDGRDCFLAKMACAASAPGRGSGTLHDFETLRFDWAKHAYCRSPASLPADVRACFEELWRDFAAHEMAGMGHVPFKYVHEFDADSDITLIELPSSGLMSWMFGDVDNLVLSMKQTDLAAGNFAALNVQVSN